MAAQQITDDRTVFALQKAACIELATFPFPSELTAAAKNYNEATLTAVSNRNELAALISSAVNHALGQSGDLNGPRATELFSALVGADRMAAAKTVCGEIATSYRFLHLLEGYIPESRHAPAVNSAEFAFNSACTEFLSSDTGRLFKLVLERARVGLSVDDRLMPWTKIVHAFATGLEPDKAVFTFLELVNAAEVADLVDVNAAEVADVED